jgi:hypothetical protein
MGDVATLLFGHFNFIIVSEHVFIPEIWCRFFTANIASQTSKRHLSACNIWTFSRRFSRNIAPRAPKIL